MKSVLVPTVKVSIERAAPAAWSGQALLPALPEIERLLLVSVRAPAAFDGLPMLSLHTRSRALIEGLQIATEGNIDARVKVIQTAGAALREDRIARMGRHDDDGALPDIDEVQRQVERSTRPRA